MCEQVDFINFCGEHIAENQINATSIVNMDEVPLTFDVPLGRTVNKVGDSSVTLRTTGNERTSFTCVLSCTASGGKLPPLVIFKRITMPKESFPKGIVVRVNKKGWMDESMFKAWMSECYSQRPGGFFRQDKGMLVMDSMRAHITEGSLAAVRKTKSVPAIIPGGTTKYLQPLDISVNRPFKVELRNEWEKWMTEGEKSFTKTGKMRKATFAQVCNWIVAAWRRVKTSAIVNGFRKAGLLSLVETETTNTATTSSACAPNQDSDSAGSDDETAGEGLNDAMLQLLVTDTEGSDFEGFEEDDDY